MNIFIRDLDKHETVPRGYISIDDVPDKDRAKCMVLDAAANLRGSAQIANYGTRTVYRNDVYYFLSQSWRYVRLFTKHGRLRPTVSNEDE
jgi:hypothetical protein